MSTYVMSDLHGRHDLFLAMLNRISFSDKDRLYILGDVADRGPDGVKSYLTIMKDPRMTLLVGNHEVMMLQAVEQAERYGTEGLYTSREWQLWEYNGGAVTWEAALDLTSEVRNSMFEYIRNSILFIPDLYVNGRDFYLCHSAHVNHYERDVKYLRGASLEDINHVVWDRVYPRTAQGMRTEGFSERGYYELYVRYPKKMKMIFGHTPTSFIAGLCPDNRCRIWHGGHGHLIDIDCGCASIRPEDAMLGCLRLDDLAEFYAHEKKSKKVRRRPSA